MANRRRKDRILGQALRRAVMVGYWEPHQLEEARGHLVFMIFSAKK